MKKLTLNKETIRDHNKAELDVVAGGGTQICPTKSISWPGCICPPPGTDSDCTCS